MREYGKATAAIHALSNTLVETTNRDSFYLVAKGTLRNGTEVPLYAGVVKPSIGVAFFGWLWGDPADDSMSLLAPQLFETAEKAVKHMNDMRRLCPNHMSPDEGLTLIAGTERVRRRVSRTLKYWDDYDAEEAEQIVSERLQGFKAYMESR